VVRVPRGAPGGQEGARLPRASGPADRSRRLGRGEDPAPEGPGRHDRDGPVALDRFAVRVAPTPPRGGTSPPAAASPLRLVPHHRGAHPGTQAPRHPGMRYPKHANGVSPFRVSGARRRHHLASCLVGGIRKCSGRAPFAGPPAGPTPKANRGHPGRPGTWVAPVKGMSGSPDNIHTGHDLRTAVSAVEFGHLRSS
jgi:hypothetical protein